MRTTFIILGLACELVGGFMLSLGLVWNVNSFLRPVNWIRTTVMRSSTSGELGCFVIFGAVALLVLVVVGLSFEEFPDNSWTRLAAIVVVLGVVAVVALCIRGFLRWVTEDEKIRTRRLGQVGFALLLVGFLAQGIVLFMTS